VDDDTQHNGSPDCDTQSHTPSATSQVRFNPSPSVQVISNRFDTLRDCPSRSDSESSVEFIDSVLQESRFTVPSVRTPVDCPSLNTSTVTSEFGHTSSCTLNTDSKLASPTALDAAMEPPTEQSSLKQRVLWSHCKRPKPSEFGTAIVSLNTGNEMPSWPQEGMLPSSCLDCVPIGVLFMFEC